MSWKQHHEESEGFASQADLALRQIESYASIFQRLSWFGLIPCRAAISRTGGSSAHRLDHHLALETRRSSPRSLAKGRFKHGLTCDSALDFARCAMRTTRHTPYAPPLSCYFPRKSTELLTGRPLPRW